MASSKRKEVKIMKRSILYALLVLGLIQAYARAEEPAAQTQRGAISEAVAREMPVLKGDTWMAMDENSKIAFIWGVGHVVTIEKVVEASNASPATMTQVAAAIDKFYTENPDKLDMPVMAVIWDTMIKPNITTGIAGQPLK
jgi:hypothetical protein